MPSGLKRYQHGKDDHFITFSCHRRNAYLTDSISRSIVEQIFERIRQRHDLRIYGYVLLPEHVHLLVSEPPRILLANVLKVMKQGTAKKLRATESISGSRAITASMSSPRRNSSRRPKTSALP